MRLQAFLWLQGLVISPHNGAPTPPPNGTTKGTDILMPRIKNAQQLHDAITQFITVATANLGALTGLTAGQLTALSGFNDDLATSITDRIAAEEAAEAATQTQNNNMTIDNDAYDAAVLIVRAVPNLDSAIVAGLGLSIRDTVPTTIIPVQPTDLVVKGFDSNINRLTWKTGGNASRTNYIIDSRPGPTGTWTFVNVTQKLTYDHLGQTPGVRMEYRVRAQRTTHESAFSNTAVVYA